MISNIFDALALYVSQNPMIAIGIVGIFIALNSLMIARWQRDRVFYENLEKSSVFQISENLKDIDGKVIKHEESPNKKEDLE